MVHKNKYELEEMKTRKFILLMKTKDKVSENHVD